MRRRCAIIVARLRSTQQIRAATSLNNSYPTLLPFFVSLAAVSKSQAHSNAHESEGREQQHEYASADGALAIFGSAGGV
jgi:hypothetical protein